MVLGARHGVSWGFASDFPARHAAFSKNPSCWSHRFRRRPVAQWDTRGRCDVRGRPPPFASAKRYSAQQGGRALSNFSLGGTVFWDSPDFAMHHLFEIHCAMSKSQFLKRLSSKLEVFVKYSTNITLPRLEITFLRSFIWGKLQISVQFVSKHCCCETKFTKNHAPTTRITLFLELRWISKRWCKSFFALSRVRAPCPRRGPASGRDEIRPVSYTHLTLPTNREV